MRRTTWVQIILAAVLVILIGAGVALAERVKINVEKQGEDVVKLDIDGVSEELRVEDLAEGEERRFVAGDHTVTVTRDGDELRLTLDGRELDSMHHGGHTAERMVWIGDNEDCQFGEHTEGGVRRVIVVRGEPDGEVSAETKVLCLRGEHDGDVTIDIDEIEERIAATGLDGFDLDVEDEKVFIMKMDGDGPHPIVIGGHGCAGADMVRYRCEDSGSVLMVPAESAIEDAYVDPATGCVMHRVEGPEKRVVKIITKHHCDDTDE